MLAIRYADYFDKVYGGWIGKCIGGAIGAAQENNKSLLHYRQDNVFPDTIVPNDDLDLQILYLQEVLEKKGSRFAARDIAEAFATYNLLMANEYSFAVKNFELGFTPPLTGTYNNSYWHHSMGCPIRSEIWGFICPGHPDAAARYAGMDGMIDHGSLSVYGEQFYAALEALSFTETDLRKLISAALAYVPADNKLSGCIRYVCELYDSRADDWADARQAMLRRYGSADASDAVTNIGLTIMALLYGEGDFGKTMLLAVNGGYDTDCTAATAGAILGVIGGAEAIPAWWREKVGDDFVIGTVAIKRYSDKIADLAKDTCAAGLSLARDGVIAVRFAGIPADVAPSLPLPAEPDSLTLSAAYEGLPSIGYGETRTVIIVVRNETDRAVDGALTFEVPPPLFAAIQRTRLTLPPRSGAEVAVTFSVTPGITVLPLKNIVTARFVDDADGAQAELRFGLSGAARMKLIGPFWDNYDTTLYDEDPYEGLTQKRPDGFGDAYAMFNGYVNLDRPYIEETDAGFDAAEGQYINLHEDRIDLSAFVGYSGPCCVYLVHDFIVPVAREACEMFVGNEEAFRVWLNGEVALESRDSAMYMPYNHFAPVIAQREGVNRVVMKLIRKGSGFDISCLMRSPQLGYHWFVDTSHVIPDGRVDNGHRDAGVQN